MFQFIGLLWATLGCKRVSAVWRWRNPHSVHPATGCRCEQSPAIFPPPRCAVSPPRCLRLPDNMEDEVDVDIEGDELDGGVG